MRTWSIVVAAVLAVGCGDNEHGPALAHSDQVVVVAHQDDEHLFMQPDLSDALHAGTTTTIVYITAGDANTGLPFALSRIAASKAAYTVLLGASDWDCGWIAITGHAALSCRLAGAPLTLLFLGYPDGGVGGEFPNSLLRLWEGQVTQVTTVAEHPTSYSRDGLIAAVGEVLRQTSPSTIRTLEVSATHGDDHSDHMFVGTLTMLAALRSHSHAALLAYRGYDINYEPATTPDELYGYGSRSMRAYEACLTSCTGGLCGVSPCDTLDDPRYFNFVHRRYAVAIQQPPLEGVLHTDAGCLTATAGALALGPCSAGADIELQPGGLVAVGGGCLEIEPGGTLAIGACDPTPAREFALDDEGHLFSAEPVVPQPALDTMHDLCVVGDGDGLRADVCGSARDARWDLLRRSVVTPRPTVATSNHGRSLRIGDLTGDGLADLCWIGAHYALACATGDGTGGFGAVVTIAPSFEVERSSLVLGDIDHDGRLDACGRDSLGVTCATAASGFTPVRWSDAFADEGLSTSTDDSLAIVEGALCATTNAGVECTRDRTTWTVSTWPAEHAIDAPAWPADLDGDDRPDWCVATPGGVNCGLAAEHNITDDGVAWGYSDHAQIESSVAVDGALDSVERSAVADITGDGRADMCVALHGTVQCAVSQGHGFGPRRTMIAMPTQAPIVGLWLGDLDGDGKADPCADDGTSITCALSP
ncbi:MAG: FG-GAP-like repeat-containing protein [Kofleriaceae bacterium]